jgi:DNA-binding LacI/PurR family transcriptional regulator
MAYAPPIRRGKRTPLRLNGRTAGALGVLREQGLRVPEQVALAGFDDLDFAAHLDPPLTTVRQSIRQLGAEAAESLLGLQEAPAAAPRRVILPTELVIRQSTAGGVPRP